MNKPSLKQEARQNSRFYSGAQVGASGTGSGDKGQASLPPWVLALPPCGVLYPLRPPPGQVQVQAQPPSWALCTPNCPTAKAHAFGVISLCTTHCACGRSWTTALRAHSYLLTVCAHAHTLLSYQTQLITHKLKDKWWANWREQRQSITLSPYKALRAQDPVHPHTRGSLKLVVTPSVTHCAGSPAREATWWLVQGQLPTYQLADLRQGHSLSCSFLACKMRVITHHNSKHCWRRCVASIHGKLLAQCLEHSPGSIHYRSP